MIKLGCNAMHKLGTPGTYTEVETLVDLIHELRFDFVDFQLYRGFPSRETEFLLHLKQKCHGYGLPVGFVAPEGGFLGSTTTPGGAVVGVPLSAEELRATIAGAKNAVDVAVLMGAPLIRIFGGGVPDQSEDRDRLWQIVVSSFQEVADYAEDKGVFIGLHNHAPAVPPTGDDILYLLQAVDRPNFTFILDTGQWWGSPGTNREAIGDPDIDFYAYMIQTAPYATYVRAKLYRIDSGEERVIDYRRIMPIIRDVGFNGNMSIVFEDRGNDCSYEECLRLGSRYLRGLLTEFRM